MVLYAVYYKGNFVRAYDAERHARALITKRVYDDEAERAFYAIRRFREVACDDNG